MGIWQKIKNVVKRVFSGGRAKATAPKTRTVYSNSSARSQGSSSSFNRRALLNSLREEQEKKEKEEKLKEAYKATKREAQDITAAFKKESTPDPKAEAAKKSRAEMRKKLDAKKQERKEWHEATNNRFNVGEKGISEEERKRRRQNVKMRAWDEKTAVKEAEHTMKWHGKEESFARGALSGVTFGASDLAAKKLTKGEAKKAEEVYQKKKHKGYEVAGEVVGSLASFGATAGATEKAAAKLTSKVAPRAAERLAEKEIIKGAAKRSVEKAVKKGVVSEASEELIKQVGKDKASKIVKALGTDIVQNLTTGAIYDVNRASTEHEVGSADWWKELGKSAAFNFGVTGAVAGASALSGGKRLAKEAADTLASRSAKEAAENIPTNYKVGLNRRRRADVVLPTEKRAIESASNIEADIATLRRRKAQLDEQANNAWLANDTDSFNYLSSESDKINKAIGNAEKRLGSQQMNLNEEVAKTASKSETPKPKTEAPKPKTAETTPPKTARQKRMDEAEERRMLDEVQRQRETSMANEIRRQTGGEYSYRQGEHTSTANVSIDKARQIEQEQKSVLKRLKERGAKDLFTDEGTPVGVFKTANEEEMKKVSREAATRVREDAQGVIKRLRELNERLLAEADKSALTSSEHITFDDIADITALEQMFDDAGIQIPKEYEDAFSHILEWQGTEAGQMLKMRDLYLKENSKAYRKKLISRDVDRYIRKVLNGDDSTISDIRRSLDANHGEGYFDRMVEELSNFKGTENEAAFRKAYANFQKEIFMNTKPTVWDAVNLWRHSFMLSSPKTGANNIIGNLMQRAMYNVSDSLNAVGESIAQGVNKDVKRTTALLKTEDQRRLAHMFTSGKLGEHNLKNADYIKGFKDQKFADAINNAAKADVEDMMASSKYMGDVVKGLKYKPTTTGGKIKQGFVKGGRLGSEYVSLMLNEPDSWFVERNYRSALVKYLEANGINSADTLASKNGEKVLREARNYAKDIALENTYKKANNVVSFLEGLRRKGHTKGSGAGYKAAAITLDAELPYLKVPANLIVNNFKYSPLGLGKGAIDAFRGVVKGDTNLLNKATRELSKGLTGTGMAMLGYMMFCRDQMDDDSIGFIGNAKDELKEYGLKDNSFKIGNHVFNISNMGIGSVQFLMGASFAEDLAENGITPPHQMAFDALGKTVDTVADMSLMENAVSLLDLFGNGGDYNATVSDRLGNAGTEIAGDYAAQFIPNPLRGVAKGMTDADLDTGIKKGDRTKTQKILNRNFNNFVQGVPVLNEAILPHKVDTHGNLINERTTSSDKAKAILNNTLNPLTSSKVHIPEADKEELRVTTEKGTPFKPKGFDQNREYKAKVGVGKGRAEIALTGKEREQVARAAKNSGYDGAMNVIKKGMFGDRLGDRAQSILRDIPDDEEKAREYIFNTPEWKGASNAQKEKWLKAWYGEGQGNTSKGVARTRNAEAFIGIAGNSEGDFRWQNDLTSRNQEKYNEAGLAQVGIDKGTWVDILEACQDSNHKWNEETQKNQDIINSAKKTKLGILSVEGLTPEQRIAAYQTIRGKRNGFGWYDWDGISAGGRYYRRGYRRYHRRGGGRTKVKALKQSDFKATKRTYKDTAATLKTSSSRSKGLSSAASPVKVEPPKVKFKKYEV